MGSRPPRSSYHDRSRPRTRTSRTKIPLIHCLFFPFIVPFLSQQRKLGYTKSLHRLHAVLHHLASTIGRPYLVFDLVVFLFFLLSFLFGNLWLIFVQTNSYYTYAYQVFCRPLVEITPPFFNAEVNNLPSLCIAEPPPITYSHPAMCLYPHMIIVL